MGEANGRGRHEVETNNWYNDISTRDRSREGAEEAIDLSEGFKNPNYFDREVGSSSAPAARSVRTGRGVRAVPER